MSRQSKNFEEFLVKFKDRLYSSTSWFPFPFLISFITVLVFMGHSLFGINKRLGSPADLVQLAAEDEPEGSIWISCSPDQDEIVVTTSQKDVFRWSKNIENTEEITPLTDYLKKQIISMSYSANLQKRVSVAETKVVIAIDKTLKYKDVKPIIYALAQAAISDYAFEVKKPFQTSEEDEIEE